MNKSIRFAVFCLMTVFVAAESLAAVCTVNAGLIVPPNADIQLNGAAGVQGLVIGVGQPDCKIAPVPPGCNKDGGVAYVNGTATTLPANTGQLNAVSVASTNYAVAVGDQKGNMPTALVQFNGTSWTAMPTTGTAPTQDANGVLTYGPNQTYVVADQGIYFFDGTRWTRQLAIGIVPKIGNQKAGKFVGIWGNADASTIYALADNGALYVTVAGLWVQITLPNFAQGADFKGIAGDAAGNVYLTGQDKNNKGFVYQYDPGLLGGTWTNLITSTTKMDLNGVAVNPVNGAITAVGDKGAMLVSGPGGAGPWTQTLEANNVNDINGVYIAADGTTYLAGQMAAGCTTAAVDHIEIQHGGSGLTCSPQTVTLKACADAACNTLYTGGGLTVTTMPGGQTFAIDATGINSAATVQQTTAGTVTLGATANPAAGTTTCVNTTSPGAPNPCDMTFATAGFVVTAPNHAACSNATVTIEAKQANAANRCVPAFRNVTRSVDLSIAYVNPSTGTKSATVATGTIGTAASAHSLSFDANGTATLSMSYPDVGQVTLNAAGTAPNGVAMSGSGDFIAAPASLGISATTPASPVKAGNPFDVTVLGYTAVSAACPAALETPNYGHETPAQLELIHTLVGPAGGADPALSAPAFTTLTSGIKSTQSWSEVGDITLKARLLPDATNTAVSNYLGYVLGAEIGATSGTVRFIPDHLDTAVVQVGGVPMACPAGSVCPAAFNGMVYSGQPFSLQVTARNLGGGATTNYDGALGYSKAVTLTAWDAKGGTTTPVGGALANNNIVAAGFSAGVATTAIPTYTFAVSPANPTDIYLRAVDADNVSSRRAGAPATSVEGGVKTASGRFRIANAHGSELLPLPMTVTVQYYNGNTWVSSATDNATTFDSNLVAAGGNLVAAIVNGLGGGVAVANPGAAPVSSGVRTFRLAAPNASGSANISLNAPGYLLAGSNGAGVNPSNTGRATFGVYKGNNEFIYQRETY